MKKSSLKYSIIINLIISCVGAFVVVVAASMVLLILMYILSKDMYNGFIQLYHEDRRVMEWFAIIYFAIYFIMTFVIFMVRMSKITSYIDEISENLNLVAEGDLNINIPIRSNDELGNLAKNVNKTVYNLKNLIDKQREWEKHKNNLITNLSHDLRTPLTSILGFLELIESGKYKDEESLKHYCNVSLTKARELNGAIEQLFEFTTINDSDSKLNKKNINIEELVEQVILGFIPSFEKKDMKYKICINDKLPIMNVDAKLLGRAFENIIINSIKYGSEGKYLKVEISRRNNEALISFINYGEKMEKEELDNLFEKFYRTEKTCKKQEGTGLGLAIVKAIVEQHEGRIEVESSDERTSFTIVLPIE